MVLILLSLLSQLLPAKAIIKIVATRVPNFHALNPKPELLSEPNHDLHEGRGICESGVYIRIDGPFGSFHGDFPDLTFCETARFHAIDIDKDLSSRNP